MKCNSYLNQIKSKEHNNKNLPGAQMMLLLYGPTSGVGSRKEEGEVASSTVGGGSVVMLTCGWENEHISIMQKICKNFLLRKCEMEGQLIGIVIQVEPCWKKPTGNKLLSLGLQDDASHSEDANWFV